VERAVKRCSVPKLWEKNPKKGVKKSQKKTRPQEKVERKGRKKERSLQEAKKKKKNASGTPRGQKTPEQGEKKNRRGKKVPFATPPDKKPQRTMQPKKGEKKVYRVTLKLREKKHRAGKKNTKKRTERDKKAAWSGKKGEEKQLRRTTIV